MANISDKDLLSGNVGKTLIVFSIPLLITTLLQCLISLIDMIIVSRAMGAVGSSGIGVGAQVMYLVINAIVGICVGGTILMAQQIGGRRVDNMERVINSLFTSTLFMAIITMLLIALTIPLFLKILNVPDQAYDYAKSYILINIIGLIFIFGYNAIFAVMRAFGDSKSPLILISIAVILNIILDVIAVNYVKNIIVGVSFATIISQAICFVFSVFVLRKHKKKYNYSKFRLKCCKEDLKMILKLGIPKAIQNSTATISFIILSYVVIKVGGEMSLYTLSASAIVSKYNNFAVLPARAFSGAICVIVAQCVGAKVIKRGIKCAKLGLIYGVIFGAVFVAVSLLFANGIFKLFNSNDQTLFYGKQYLFWLCADYILLPISTAMFGYLDGLGKTFVTMAVNTFTSILIRIPLALLFGVVFKMGMKGVGIAIPLTSIIAILLTSVYLLVYKKNHKQTYPCS